MSWPGTPPSANLAKAGYMRNVHPYPLMVDTRLAPSMAEVMIKELKSGVIDVAVLWGPMAGYYAKQIDPDLAFVPLLNEVGPHGIPDHHGRTAIGPGMETDAEQGD